MKKEKGLHQKAMEPQINRFFSAVDGETKEILISWHDYEDGRSLQKTIHIPIEQDPEVGATNFLTEYVPNQYEFEWAKESWRIEIGPVFEGPGPGDGSDAPFNIITFHGTEADAKAKSIEMSSQWKTDYGTRINDLGRYRVGASVTRIS